MVNYLTQERSKLSKVKQKEQKVRTYNSAILIQFHQWSYLRTSLSNCEEILLFHSVKGLHMMNATVSLTQHILMRFGL